MKRRTSGPACAAALLSLALASPAATQGQQPQSPPMSDPQGEIKTMRVDPATGYTGPGNSSYVASAAIGAQTYNDPSSRFSFTVPLQWSRLASGADGEVTFQSPTGDSIRISVAPLKVDAKSFANAYVDTYMQVLSQSFTDVRFLGQRTIQLSNHDATDYVFSADYHSSPVLCHQVVLLTPDQVLYVTFAGFGANREVEEQNFLASVLSFWVDPSFVGRVSSSTAGPSYVFPIPEGWAEQPVEQVGVRTFRPPNAHPTSALITVFKYKANADDPAAVDNAFVLTYTARLHAMFPQGQIEIQKTSSTKLGNDQAIRYDLTYVSDEGGMRRVILELCIHDGYVVGVSCDSADSGFPTYQKAFESLYAGFKFQ